MKNLYSSPLRRLSAFLFLLGLSYTGSTSDIIVTEDRIIYKKKQEFTEIHEMKDLNSLIGSSVINYIYLEPQKEKVSRIQDYISKNKLGVVMSIHQVEPHEKYIQMRPRRKLNVFLTEKGNVLFDGTSLFSFKDSKDMFNYITPFDTMIFFMNEGSNSIYKKMRAEIDQHFKKHPPFILSESSGGVDSTWLFKRVFKIRSEIDPKDDHSGEFFKTWKPKKIQPKPKRRYDSSGSRSQWSHSFRGPKLETYEGDKKRPFNYVSHQFRAKDDSLVELQMTYLHGEPLSCSRVSLVDPGKHVDLEKTGIQEIVKIISSSNVEMKAITRTVVGRDFTTNPPTPYVTPIRGWLMPNVEEKADTHLETVMVSVDHLQFKARYGISTLKEIEPYNYAYDKISWQTKVQGPLIENKDKFHRRSHQFAASDGSLIEGEIRYREGHPHSFLKLTLLNPEKYLDLNKEEVQEVVKIIPGSNVQLEAKFKFEVGLDYRDDPPSQFIDQFASSWKPKVESKPYQRGKTTISTTDEIRFDLSFQAMKLRKRENPKHGVKYSLVE